MAKEVELTTEQMQARITANDLKISERKLAAAEREEAAFAQADAQRRKSNQQRQAELANGRATAKAIQKKCRHMSGGRPGNILKGGGIGAFSIVTRYLMPDGVTHLLQCARCRLKEYTPRKPLKAEFDTEAAFSKAMRVYEAQKEAFDELYAASEDAGLAEMRGPTFMFKNSDGVPVIPAMV